MLSEKVRHLLYDSISFSLTRGYIFIDPSERGREGERKNIDVRKKHQSAAPHKPHALTKDHTLNLGTCPDQELNLLAYGRCSNQLSHPGRAV